jgi:hypothetical protein
MMNDDDDDDIAAADIDEAPQFEQANANNNSHQIYTLAGAHPPTNSPGSSSTNENEGQIEPESSPDMYMHNAIAYLKRVRFSGAMKSARESAATCADNRRAASLQRQAAESARRAKNL